MSNMSYCRFENTVEDLQDCFEHINDQLSQREHDARLELVNLCQNIIKQFEDPDPAARDE